VSTPDTDLADLAETDVITANPDDDQEDVADDVAKYNLLAMPVIDEERHLLGIVTVDDALDVMEEEHEEDLKIAGGSHDDTSSDESDHVLRRMLSHEMWFFFWVLGFALLGAITSTFVGGSSMVGLAVAFALPVCLNGADDMVRYITNFFLEFDEDDEDAPSLAGFTFKGLGVGFFYAALVLLIGIGASSTVAGLLPTGSASALTFSAISVGFVASAVTTVIGFATAPIYLTCLRRRDDAGEDTSGLALHAIAQVVALLLFIVIACALLVGTLV
jgi:CBS domain-containing protein